MPQKGHFLINCLSEKTQPLTGTQFCEKWCFMHVVLGLGMKMCCLLVLLVLLTKRGPGHSTYKSTLQYIVFQHIELWNFSLSMKGVLIIDR